MMFVIYCHVVFDARSLPTDTTTEFSFRIGINLKRFIGITRDNRTKESHTYIQSIASR